MPELDPAALIQRYGYGLVGLVIFLESMGIPLPGESLLIAAALYAATNGGIGIEYVVLAAAIGAILGDNAGFLIGRRLGPPALRRWGPRIGLTIPRQRLGQYLFQRHGAKVVFFGRFMAFLRTFAAVLAGANAMPWPSFLLWNAIGGITWTTLYGFGAYLLGNQIHRLLGPFGLITGAIGLICIIWFFLFIRRHERRLIVEAEAALLRQS
ncbi:MAG: DedA family protein [Acetobacteraceae bacterium]